MEINLYLKIKLGLRIVDVPSNAKQYFFSLYYIEIISMSVP